MRCPTLLRYSRQQAALTQRELAQRAGISQPAVARIERSRTMPRVDTLERLLAACGFELDVRPVAGTGVDRTPIRALLRLRPAERAAVAVQEGRNVAAIATARKP